METIIVNETGGTYFFNYNLGGNCSAGDVVSFRESPSNWIHVYTDIVVQSYEHPFKVVCDDNTGGGTRDGQVIPIINEGLSTEKVCNDKAIPFRQTGTTCGCGDFQLSTNNLSWSSADVSPQYNTFTLKGDCIDVVTATSTNNHFKVEVGENNIKVTPTATTATDDETGTVTVTYTEHGRDCTSLTFTVKHNGTGCGCRDFSFDESEMSWASSETDLKSRSYIVKGDCINVVTATSNSNHFSVTAGTDSISVQPTTANTGTDPINGTITVTYEANGGNCTSKTFSVKHSGTGCDCYISITGVTEWPATLYGSDNAKYIKYDYDSSCIDGDSITISNNNDTDFFAELDKTNKQIKVYPKNENDDRTSPNAATITINFEGVAGFSCSNYQTTSLTQKKSDRCDDCGLVKGLTKKEGYVGEVNEQDVFIFPIKKKEYVFASASTRPDASSPACGDFSLFTTATTAQFTKVNDTQYNRTFKVKFNQDAEAKAYSLRISFVYNDGRPECHKDFLFIQQECNCIDGLDGWGWPILTPSPLEPNEYSQVSIQTKTGAISSDCMDYGLTTDSSTWIQGLTVRITDTPRTWLDADIKANTGRTERTGHVYITPKVKYNGQEFTCSSSYKKEVTVKQKPINCDCGETDKVSSASSAQDTKVYLYGSKYYDKSCFNSSITDPNLYFTITTNKSWIHLDSQTYLERSGLYEAQNIVTLDANTDEDPREGVINVKVNLVGDSNCTFKWTIRQSGATCEDCTAANRNIYSYSTDSSMRSYKAGRSGIGYYNGTCTDYTLKLTGSTPSWIENVSNYERTSSTDFDKKRLYCDYKANSGTTGGAPVDDPLYKTQDRHATLTLYLEKGDGTICPTKNIEIWQEGWSGSCTCDGTIVFDNSTCGEEYVDSETGSIYRAFSDDDQTHDLCYYKLNEDGECSRKVVVTSQFSRYFDSLTTATTSVTINNVEYDHCVRGKISNYASQGTPVSITLTMHRNIGGTNYESCENVTAYPQLFIKVQ